MAVRRDACEFLEQVIERFNDENTRDIKQLKEKQSEVMYWGLSISRTQNAPYLHV